jgi:hypothetical protein
LSQARAIDVVDFRDIEDKEAVSLPQQFVNPIMEMKILNPQSADHIQYHDFTNDARVNFESHNGNDNSKLRCSESPFTLGNFKEAVGVEFASP